jgi:hypothetical protein
MKLLSEDLAILPMNIAQNFGPTRLSSAPEITAAIDGSCGHWQ